MSVEVIDRLTGKQAEDLCGMYQSGWWTRGRRLSDVRRMLRHPDVIVALCETETVAWLRLRES
ncbi:MAG: hypothetical protein V3U52_05070 [Thermoplasmata archaeon]